MDSPPKVLDFSQISVAEIPQSGKDRVNKLLDSGNLFRYSEGKGSDSAVAQLESEFADFFGKKYAIGVNSGGSALFIALKAVGVSSGDIVMLNAFTLAPVPSAIENCSCETILLDTTDDLVIDIESLKHAVKTTGAKILLLSYMRGHIPNMDDIMKVVKDNNLTLIEDCAHVMGAKWKNHDMGTLGDVSCFSLQTFKQVNGGEGGIILCDDDDIAARAILMSGSYMLYEQHLSRPPSEVFDKWVATTPNFSLRLNEISAALVSSQLPTLREKIVKWNNVYEQIASGIREIDGLSLPNISPDLQPAPTSIQFFCPRDGEEISAAIATAKSFGLNIKWFGNPQPQGFTSNYHHWNYLSSQKMKNTDVLMEGLLDIRLPSTLSEQQCKDIIAILRYSF
ncbi:MAG: DegT/DnrJ/EryC1/StrS family aminotransferase [Candidatus Poseidoniales archaeon]|jgi:dTDP-4-amino-4,6-dideoxygalactose transaminase